MFIRGNAYNAWIEKQLKEECFTQEVENGCHIEVRARERTDADIEVLVCVYTATGQCVAERSQQLPGAEWTVRDALKRGIDQAERIAGGESGRLPCADAHLHEDD
ncbi:hypothetical protein [Pseudomonas asgharzadehiana]|uniref:Uncharacterized protein n=1 Tax=Pseudomonas asgharzadehiana TaxID=2842349 RepID=A0ABX8NTS3_9PSED|nr:hypothetical protein [Pseudomonas asgharzadehiana]QXH64849.1 hypothetical protein KSS96_14510 [Pseudomonas asgharzadehiana]